MNMLGYIVSIDVVVAVICTSQDEATIGVGVDHTEAFPVGHPQFGVVGSSHHRVTGKDVQPIAASDWMAVNGNVCSLDSLALNVRVEGCGLVIGDHGHRHGPASFNISPDSLGHSCPSLVTGVVDAQFPAVHQPVKHLW